MKTKLMSAVALSALLAFGASSAFAQETSPTPSPTPSEQRMPNATPSPAPTPSMTDPASPARAAGTFASNQAADEWRSSKLVGMTVYNKANDKIGSINDLVMGPDGKISHAVIGVGGFLGMGEKLVGISFSDLQLNRDTDGKTHVIVDSTKEALENAPDYKYHDMRSSSRKD